MCGKRRADTWIQGGGGGGGGGWGGLTFLFEWPKWGMGHASSTPLAAPVRTRNAAMNNK